MDITKRSDPFWATIFVVLVFGAIIVLAVTVGPGETARPVETAPDLVQVTEHMYRITDVEAGVVCYAVESGYGGGVDCLPLGHTQLIELGR